MAIETINNYLHVVSGLTRTTRERATAMARALLAQAGLEGVAADAGERVSKLAEEIMNAAHANRELLERLIASEVDKAAARLGFARAEQLDSLRAELAELRRLMEAQQTSGDGSDTIGAGTVAAAKRARPRSAAAEPPASVGAARKTAAKKAATRKAPAKKTAAGRETAGTEFVAEATEPLGEDLGI